MYKTIYQIKLCKTSGSINLFRIQGTLKSGDIKLNTHYLWDTFEINCNGIKLILNGNKIDLPQNNHNENMRQNKSQKNDRSRTTELTCNVTTRNNMV